MTSHVSFLVRQQALAFPDDAPRGAVTRFCEEHQVSRAWFYKVRSRARTQGMEHARYPLPPLAHTIPGHTPDTIEQAAIMIRGELHTQGWDCGPISVAHEMTKRGLTPPSRATLARIFTRHGLVKPEPRKRPRSTYIAFSYPAPNACWQIDGTSYTIGDHTTWCILQMEDDHSRMILATHTASYETVDAAITVFDKAVAVYGIPQHILTDNGFAFNRERWGITTQFTTHVRSLGVEPITGRPRTPTTQGKQERLHQTLHRFLDAHQPIRDKSHLDRLLADFQDYYNTQRPHQGHTPHTPPSTVYHATPKTEPPGEPTHAPSHHVERVVKPDGRIRADYYRIYIGMDRVGDTMIVIITWDTLTIIDAATGEILGNIPKPAIKTDATLSIKQPDHNKQLSTKLRHPQ